MEIMARHTSIFLNMQDYRDQVPETQRFHLNEVQDPDFLPLSFRRRIEKLEEDVRVQGSISTDLNSLFIVLNLRMKDLTKEPLPELYRQLRTTLKKHAGIEIAPPGNILELNENTRFRICPAFDLNRDPDIVSARQNCGAANLGRILENRIKTASNKINNFAVSLHVFESLFLVNNPGSFLNTEQRYFLQNFIENECFPADTQRYLQSCFSQIIDLAPQINELNPEKAYLKPIKNPDVLNKYLRIISGMAALSEHKVTFEQSPYREKLVEMTRRARVKNTADTLPGTIQEKNLSALLQREIGDTDVFSSFEPLFKNKSVCRMDQKSINLHLEHCRRYFDIEGYTDSSMLTFKTGHDMALIGGMAVDDANMYMAKTSAAAESRHWDFALNGSPFIHQIHSAGKYRYQPVQPSDNEQGLKYLAGMLNKSYTVPLLNDQLILIAANLEYRLLAEDTLCGRLTDVERIKTFIILVNWFRNATRANDSTSYDLRSSLDYFGGIIAIFAFMHKNEIYDSHLTMLSVFPECRDYALYRLSALNSEGKLTQENSLPYIFSGFILSHPGYNLNIRIQGDARPVLYSHARKLFNAMIAEDPLLPAKLLQGLEFTDTPVELTDRYPSLKSFKNKVIAPMLPPKVVLGEKGRELVNGIVTRIKKEQDTFLTYLGSAGSNVCNDLVYRIYEYSLSGENRLPAGLRNFRKTLLNSDISSFAELRQQFNLNISYHSCCARIFSECASILDVTIFPNFSFESEELVVNAFDYMTFGELKLKSHPYNRKLILPYRIILNTCTGFKTIKLIHEFFSNVISRKQLKELQDYSDEQISDLLTYVARITEIKMSTNLRCRFKNTADKNRYEFDGLQKGLFRSLFRILVTGGEVDLLNRTVRSLNKLLKEPVIEENEMTIRKFASTRGGYFGGLPDHDDLMPKVNSPENLDMDLISQTTLETRKVQEILAPIFAENDTGYSSAETAQVPEKKAETVTEDSGKNAGKKQNEETAPENVSGMAVLELLAPEYQALLKRLLQVGEFTMNDFKSFCAEKNLMASGAMEVINSWALEQFDCTIIEEDEPMFFDRDLLTELFE